MRYASFDTLSLAYSRCSFVLSLSVCAVRNAKAADQSACSNYTCFARWVSVLVCLAARVARSLALCSVCSLLFMHFKQYIVYKLHKRSTSCHHNEEYKLIFACINLQFVEPALAFTDIALPGLISITLQYCKHFIHFQLISSLKIS